VILLKSGSNAAVKGDAAVAMLSVSSLAVGYLLMNVFSSSSNLSGDVCTTLFGSTSILTLSENDVKLCVILSVITVIMFVYFYNRIFAVTFDEEFASACGTNAKLCNLITAVTTAAVIVLSMKLAGALLISALVVFPALSAMRVFRSFMAVTVCSAVISVICAISGMLVSILAGTPVGSTVAAADMIMFAVFFIAGKILGRR
ncbi:MAG: metal ABC transporter permease, partial [Synergistaceae bacterium]|nr:metal ABC transporter permease [Synergistaceae bacterium]